MLLNIYLLSLYYMPGPGLGRHWRYTHEQHRNEPWLPGVCSLIKVIIFILKYGPQSQNLSLFKNNLIITFNIVFNYNKVFMTKLFSRKALSGRHLWVLKGKILLYWK